MVLPVACPPKRSISIEINRATMNRTTRSPISVNARRGDVAGRSTVGGSLANPWCDGGRWCGTCHRPTRLHSIAVESSRQFNHHRRLTYLQRWYRRLTHL